MFMITGKEFNDIAEGTCSEDLLERTIEYTMSTYEMPYGVQKARTGDPYEWANDWLIKNFMKETKMEYDVLNESLKVGVVTVLFTKRNGEERNMVCTKDLTRVPQDQLPAQEDLPIAVNEDVMRVYDLEKSDWRSFRKDSVIKWEAL